MQNFKWVLVFLISSVLLMGCSGVGNHILVRFDQTDSITVQEFQQVLKKDFDNRTVTFDEKRKALYNYLDNRLRMIGALEEKIDQNEDVRNTLRKIEQDLLLAAAKDKYVYRALMPDSLVEFFRNNYGREVEVKNFVYRYKDNPRSKVARTYEEAAHFVDSIYSVITPETYDTLTFQYSEYIDRHTGKGNYRPDKLKFGTLPYNYENTVFRYQPGVIIKPVEIPGAFLIPYIIRMDTAYRSAMTLDEARRSLKSKMDMVDAAMVSQKFNAITDSLLETYGIRVHKENAQYFLRQYCLGLSGDSVRKIMAATDEEKILLENPGDAPVTYKSFLSNYHGNSILPVMTAEQFYNQLKDPLRIHILIRKITEDGYKQTEDFRFDYTFKVQDVLIQKLRSVKFSSTDSVSASDLRRYYENHMEKYVTPATVKIQELSSSNEKYLKEALNYIKADTSLERAAELVNNSYKTAQGVPAVTLKNPVVWSQNQPDELAQTAFRIHPGEITGIVKRKNGTYSLLKVIEKKDAQRQSFDAVQKRVESQYRSDLQQNKETRWLNGLKKKMNILVYENNLK